MKRGRVGLLLTAAVFAFLGLCAAVVLGIYNYNRFQYLGMQISDVQSIPEAMAAGDDIWHNPNADMEYTAGDESAEDYLYYYKYDNIDFISYSEAWDESMLEALKEELLLNRHGPELDYLEKVIIYAQEDPAALGFQSDDVKNYPVELYLPGLLPENTVYNFTALSSTIEIMGGDTLTGVEQVARTLSHEYGHHFTNYYFFNDFDDLSDSEYYALRDNPDLDIFYEWGDVQHYYNHHDWYLWELAADDYVYFYGSPNTRFTEDYLDDLEVLKLDVKSRKKFNAYYDSLSYDSFNLSPQSNMEVMLADKVGGLQALFEQCLDTHLQANPYDASQISIEINGRYSHGYKHYEITWNKPWAGEDVLYTLVAYNEDGTLYNPVKTINGSESAKAYMGQVIYSNYYLDVDLPDQLTFRVIVTFPEGFAAVSPAVTKEF